MRSRYSTTRRLFMSLKRVAVPLTASTLALVVVPAITPAGADSSLNPAAAAATTACTVSPILVNSCRPWLGAYAAGYSQAADNFKAQTLYHEKRINRQLDIVRDYYGPSSKVLDSYDTYFAERPDTILELMWNPVNIWGSISSDNAKIDSMAASIKALALPAVIRQ